MVRFKKSILLLIIGFLLLILATPKKAEVASMSVQTGGFGDIEGGLYGAGIFALPYILPSAGPEANAVIGDELGVYGIVLTLSNPPLAVLTAVATIVLAAEPLSTSTQISYNMVGPLEGFYIEPIPNLNSTQSQTVTTKTWGAFDKTTYTPDSWGIGGTIMDPNGHKVGVIIIWYNWGPGQHKKKPTQTEKQLLDFIKNAPRFQFNNKNWIPIDLSMANMINTKSMYQISKVKLSSHQNPSQYNYEFYISYKDNAQLAAGGKWIVNSQGLFLNKDNISTAAYNVLGFNAETKVTAEVIQSDGDTEIKTFNNYLAVLKSLPIDNSTLTYEGYQPPSNIAVNVQNSSGESIPYKIHKVSGSNVACTLNYKYPINEDWVFGACITDTSPSSITKESILSKFNITQQKNEKYASFITGSIIITNHPDNLSKIYGPIKYSSENFTLGKMNIYVGYINTNGYNYNIQNPQQNNNQLVFDLTIELPKQPISKETENGSASDNSSIGEKSKNTETTGTKTNASGKDTQTKATTTSPFGQVAMVLTAQNGNAEKFTLSSINDSKNAVNELTLTSTNEKWYFGGKTQSSDGSVIGSVFITNDLSNTELIKMASISPAPQVTTQPVSYNGINYKVYYQQAAGYGYWVKCNGHVKGVLQFDIQIYRTPEDKEDI